MCCRYHAQHTASTLQHTANIMKIMCFLLKKHCIALQRTAYAEMCMCRLLHLETCILLLILVYSRIHTATALQHTETDCNTFQLTALQHTATHYTTRYFYRDVCVTFVACGDFHTAAISRLQSFGKLWTWGDGDDGAWVHMCTACIYVCILDTCMD